MTVALHPDCHQKAAPQRGGSNATAHAMSTYCAEAMSAYCADLQAQAPYNSKEVQPQLNGYPMLQFMMMQQMPAQHPQAFFIGTVPMACGPDQNGANNMASAPQIPGPPFQGANQTSQSSRSSNEVDPEGGDSAGRRRRPRRTNNRGDHRGDHRGERVPVMVAPPANVARQAAVQPAGGWCHKMQPQQLHQDGFKPMNHADMVKAPHQNSLDPVDSLGDPRCLADNMELANRLSSQLESSDRATRTAILKWLVSDALDLALSMCGCRVVQKVLEVVGGEDRALLVEKFHGQSLALVESPHGNHVLQKCIEVMPPLAVRFVLDELSFYQGGWAALARHRFGCRVVERLLEYCPEDMTGPLFTALIADTCTLCRHPYGNYVVQHVLEYGGQGHQEAVVSALVQGGVAVLAQHHVACHVIERAFTQCGRSGQQALAGAILDAPPALLTMACSRNGGYTVSRMLEVLTGPMREGVLHQLHAGAPQLRLSKHGKELLDRVNVSSP